MSPPPPAPPSNPSPDLTSKEPLVKVSNAVRVAISNGPAANAETIKKKMEKKNKSKLAHTARPPPLLIRTSQKEPPPLPRTPPPMGTKARPPTPLRSNSPKPKAAMSLWTWFWTHQYPPQHTHTQPQNLAGLPHATTCPPSQENDPPPHQHLPLPMSIPSQVQPLKKSSQTPPWTSPCPLWTKAHPR
jgi:hypothetical protein